MENKKIKILVACHKPCEVYHDDVYTPIHVGRAMSKYVKDLNWMIGDNTGDNISEKNGSFCELTALYWAWKNMKNVDYIGLCHYRRYFDFLRQVTSTLPIYSMPEESFKEYNPIMTYKTIKALSRGEVIVAKKQYHRESLITQYSLNHVSDDLRTLREVIRQKGEKKYVKSFESVMFGNKYSPYNMFVMSKGHFDMYCKWLFDVLFEVEKRTDISHYNPVQKRIYGYMSERLLNVFLKANRFKEYEVPVVIFDNNALSQNKSIVEYHLNTFIKNLIFKLSVPPHFE